MTSLKPSSITSFMAAKPSTITKKRKPEVIEIAADEIPVRLMIVTTEKVGRVVDVEVGVASSGAFISFNVVEKPTAKAEPALRNFKPTWSSMNEFLVQEKFGLKRDLAGWLFGRAVICCVKVYVKVWGALSERHEMQETLRSYESYFMTGVENTESWADRPRTLAWRTLYSYRNAHKKPTCNR